MNRLIFSAIGVILTFAWIVYTAPNKQNKVEAPEAGRIKKISRSGSTSLNKISQPVYKNAESAKTDAGNSNANSGSDLVVTANERQK